MPGALTLLDDEGGVTEHLQMLGHCGPADRQLSRQLAYGTGTFGHKLEHPAPSGIGQSGQSVSDHLP